MRCKKFMYETICEHDLLHVFERHECDGCCAQIILTEKEKENSNE